jgi:DNA polymerase
LEWEAELSTLGIPHATLARGSATHVDPAPVVLAKALTAPETPDVVVSGRVAELPSGRAQAAAQLPEPQGPQPLRASAAAVPTDKRARLALLDQEVRACTRCELAKGRTHTVFARGNPDSAIAFVGEGPGQEEDRVGSPFVGAAGQLLDKMVGAMGFGRDDVYICNVVKCRPPGNRTPLPVEAQACAPYLLGQLEAVQPRVIVALGRCAAENMGLVGAGGWRGRWGKFQGVDVMPTYHPAFLLRSPEYKRPVWEDLQQVMARLKQLG